MLTLFQDYAPTLILTAAVLWLWRSRWNVRRMLLEAAQRDREERIRQRTRDDALDREIAETRAAILSVRGLIGSLGDPAELSREQVFAALRKSEQFDVVRPWLSKRFIGQYHASQFYQAPKAESGRRALIQLASELDIAYRELDIAYRNAVGRARATRMCRGCSVEITTTPGAGGGGGGGPNLSVPGRQLMPWW